MHASTHYAAQKQEMDAANCRSSKVTHAGRRAGAQATQSPGATIEEIAQHGNWIHERVATHYLSEIPERVPLKLAGFIHEQDHFWLKRNVLIPPSELQRLVFPEVNDAYPGEDWQLWMDNIMQDKDEHDYRGLDTRLAAKYPLDECKKIKFCIILAHLRKVVLQDAVALMELTIEPAFRYDLHHIFGEKVFRSPLFTRFRADLVEKMKTSSSPLNDSLALNAPAIQHNLQNITDVLQEVKGMLAAFPASELARERGIWTEVINRQLGTMHSNFQTVHGGLVTVNNNIAVNVNKFQKVLGDVLSKAATAVQEEIMMAPILPLPPSTSEPLFTLSSSLSSPLSSSPSSLSSSPSSSSPLSSLSASTSSSQLSQVSALLSEGASSSSPGSSSSGVYSSDASSSNALSSNASSSGASSSGASSSGASSSAFVPSALSFSLTIADLEDSDPLIEDQTVQENSGSTNSVEVNESQLQLVDLVALATSFAWPADTPDNLRTALDPRPNSFPPIWDEWFDGTKGKASIWQMNKYHPKWRAGWGTTQRKHYNYNKVLIEYALKAVQKRFFERPASAHKDSKEIIQSYALGSVHCGILNHGSLNKFYLFLLNEK